MSTELFVEVWAQLLLAEADQREIAKFFENEAGVDRRFVARNMHLTVYYARRAMQGVVPKTESARMLLPAAHTRFMVMAPGGDNPRDELVPGRRKVGIRIQRQSPAFDAILGFRERLLEFETKIVLGGRAPSGPKTNAFGARHFPN